MSRTIGVSDVAVIPGTLVCVSDYELDRSSGCFSLKDTREDLYKIAFLTCGGVAALTRLTAVKEFLDIFFVERKTGRAAVYDSSESLAMGFSPGGNGKMIPKT